MGPPLPLFPNAQGAVAGLVGANVEDVGSEARGGGDGAQAHAIGVVVEHVHEDVAGGPRQERVRCAKHLQCLWRGGDTMPGSDARLVSGSRSGC